MTQTDFQKREAERMRIWRAKNADRVRAQRRALYDSDKERTRRQRNHDKLAAYEQQRAKDPARMAFSAKWKREHPEARSRAYQARVARQGGATQNFDHQLRRLLWIRQLGECGICGAGMQDIELDHIVPLCLGGPHEESNVHLVHPECNRIKGRKLLHALGIS